MSQHALQLKGCTPEPLGNYLKALGVFRLVAEQADPGALAWWRDGFLRLASKWSEEEIVDFFLTGIGTSKLRVYRPSPIFAPWGGRPGFFDDGNDEAKMRLERIRKLGTISRYRTSTTVIDTTDRLLGQKGWKNLGKKRREKLKKDIIQTLRKIWPAEALPWFDACIAIEEDPRFGFLYGTGGNEGSADITNNFWELIEGVVGLPKAKPYAEETLRCALLGTPRTAGVPRTAGQHFPSAAGSVNSGQAFFGSASTNPWDVILMMEGCILFAGAVTKRLSLHGKGTAAFPFMLNHLTTGEPQESLKEEARQDAKVIKSRAEFWMPLWSRPISFPELKAFIAEGRLQQAKGEPAEHSIQAMDAISSLGISRGIEAFHRFALFERRGKGYYLAASLGNYPVPSKPNAASLLIGELAGIRDQSYRNLREGPGVPDRILLARQQMNAMFATIFRQSHQGSPVEADHVLQLLTRVAHLDSEVSLLKNRARRMTPCPPLGSHWDRFALDNPEYRLARAIAGIVGWGEPEDRMWTGAAVEALRTNLLPLARKGSTWQWDEKSRSSVWSSAATLFENLAAVLRQRLIDGTRGAGVGLPLWSKHGAYFADLLALWHCEVDQQRLAQLMHGLALVDSGVWQNERIDSWQQKHDPTPDLSHCAIWFDGDGNPRTTLTSLKEHGEPLPSTDIRKTEEELYSAFALPRVYALLKLCFVGGRLPARPVESRVTQRTGLESHPRCALDILSLLQAGRLSEATEIAARKLAARGYPAILDNQRSLAVDIFMSLEDCRRLAGLLLIPVRRAGILAALAIKPNSTAS